MIIQIHEMSVLKFVLQESNSRLHDLQKGEEQELRITLENDLKLLQKLQVNYPKKKEFWFWKQRIMITYLILMLRDYIQYDRRCQVSAMNKTEEGALEKKVSLRLGLLLQEWLICFQFDIICSYHMYVHM